MVYVDEVAGLTGVKAYSGIWVVALIVEVRAVVAACVGYRSEE